MVRRIKGFTLIELLIVVAIIGILAAIAVPNFLNAQMRARIAQVHSDQKAYADCLEMYYLDNTSYPWTDANPHGNDPIDKRWIALTTPIPYISGLPFDPFGDGDRLKRSGTCPDYVTYDSWIALPRLPHFSWLIIVAKELRIQPTNLRYAFVSQGPDRRVWACEGGALFYDSSNGLVSIGDILRAGPGSFSEGGR